MPQGAWYGSRILPLTKIIYAYPIGLQGYNTTLCLVPQSQKSKSIAHRSTSMNQRHFLLQEYIIDYVVLSGIIMINQPTSQVGKMKLFATSRGRKHPPPPPQLAEGMYVDCSHIHSSITQARKPV